MKKRTIIFLLLIILSIDLCWSQKTLVHHYLPTLSDYQANSYNGYDYIIVDHEVIINSPESLKLMRKNNPALKILVYANKIEWHEPMFADKPWSLKMVAELEKYPKWFLKNTKGQKIEFWPSTVMMNCTLDCPRYNINGKSYNYIEFFTERYIKDIISQYSKAGIKLDGMLDDELLRAISFLGHYSKNHYGVDRDLDGKNDESSELDRQWRLGNAYFLEQVREKMSDKFIIIGNGGHGFYMDYCNGKMFEYFPEVYLNEDDKIFEAWPENMRNAAGMNMAIFNARDGNYGRADNYFFTLCSAALLDNVIFSHGQNKPYEEKYKLNLGAPLSKYGRNENVFERRFQKGTIKIDPKLKKAWVIE